LAAALGRPACCPMRGKRHRRSGVSRHRLGRSATEARAAWPAAAEAHPAGHALAGSMARPDRAQGSGLAAEGIAGPESVQPVLLFYELPSAPGRTQSRLARGTVCRRWQPATGHWVARVIPCRCSAPFFRPARDRNRGRSVAPLRSSGSGPCCAASMGQGARLDRPDQPSQPPQQIAAAPVRRSPVGVRVRWSLRGRSRPCGALLEQVRHVW